MTVASKPRWRKQWSIGIYTGTSALELSASGAITQPVLTADDVTDVPASSVADPFLMLRGNCWHLFFEVWNGDRGCGEIGHASSPDGITFRYHEIVLREPFHLSYPFVFEWRDQVFMVPETRQSESIRLYRAESFPSHWTLVTTLARGRFADPTLVRHNDVWWLFAQRGLDELKLFFSEQLQGPWLEHPASPIVAGNRRRTRPGGRIVNDGGRLIRFAQDGLPTYGHCLRAFEIDQLSRHSYAEHELPSSPILEATGNGWNGMGMHHIDAHRLDDGSWLAAVDGATLGFY